MIVKKSVHKKCEGETMGMNFLYPGGLRKALTFSYDDGQIFDRRLAELLRSHGMKGTFHLNSGRLDPGRGNETCKHRFSLMRAAQRE